jgi:NAD(P)-dependent dehydrogenase (short-subunit alcohol dehydrogenase family)
MSSNCQKSADMRVPPPPHTHFTWSSTSALIAGIVGSGIAKRFLELGAAVAVVPARSQYSKAAILDEMAGSPLDRLDIPVVDYGTPEGARQLAEYLRAKHGVVDTVVASIGGGFSKGEPGGYFSFLRA